MELDKEEVCDGEVGLEEASPKKKKTFWMLLDTSSYMLFLW